MSTIQRPGRTGPDSLPGFLTGIKDGFSIAIGYMPIALTFGLLAKNTGINLSHTLGMSLFVFAGASQFMALGMIAVGTGAMEIVISTFIVNIRHLLMSMSLNEKVTKASKWERLFCSFGITDEVFAVASTKEEKIGPFYLYGVICMAYSSWVINSGAGHLVGTALPASIQEGMSIALYAMFIGLLVPNAKKSKKALFLALTAGGLNFVFSRFLPTGWAIVAAALGSVLLIECLKFPVREMKDER